MDKFKVGDIIVSNLASKGTVLEVYKHKLVVADFYNPTKASFDLSKEYWDQWKVEESFNVTEHKFKVGDEITTTEGEVQFEVIIGFLPQGYALGSSKVLDFTMEYIWKLSEDNTNEEPFNVIEVKQDTGKLRYDLLPFDAVDEVVKILNYGIKKYPNPEENWRDNSKPEDIKRYKAAMLRHMSELQQGRTHDIESGLHHMAHIATNSLFIIALLKQHDLYNKEI